MSIRFLRAWGLALLSACIAAIPVLAKGGYAFITITGPDLKETVRTSDAALTEDFFAFADFYRDRVEAPADAGAGYEITRYYLDGGREIAFDRLHYYPAAGVVYYDGIVTGSSEYDRKWYAAKPEIKSVFENALAGAPTIQAPAIKAEQGAGNTVTGSSQPSAILDRTEFAVSIAIASALAVTVLVFLSRRKISSLTK